MFSQSQQKIVCVLYDDPKGDFLQTMQENPFQN